MTLDKDDAKNQIQKNMQQANTPSKPEALIQIVLGRVLFRLNVTK